MGNGEKSFMNFLNHHHQKKKEVVKDVPKGCLAIKVGGEGEEQERFVVPVVYLNHPLFMHLLKETEGVYGFEQKGNITLPCNVEEFRYVRGLIDRDRSREDHHNHHHHHYNHYLIPHVGCFKA
ncbi:hypothetical protein QJS04_geneDACA012306 [Acorus gramineus]|uniref:Uncharacterized protein n=1 Tax=Acorus gramineus TaxID=55184 RepID=A0AAV9A1X4_ACOGR|nr:hypothetical protein QJS04_geneDACA012306 [Acorus gramineus]